MDMDEVSRYRWLMAVSLGAFSGLADAVVAGKDRRLRAKAVELITLVYHQIQTTDPKGWREAEEVEGLERMYRKGESA